MEREQDNPTELVELGTASEVTQGAVFGIPEADGLQPSAGISDE